MSGDRVAEIMDQIVRDREHEPELQLFAILDGAQSKEIHKRIKKSGHKSACLYKGAPPRLERAAPWLVALEGGGSAFFEWLVEAGWGKSWGIYLLTMQSLGELRKHFRRFLQVYREDGRRMYFRYYDPRVTRSYFHTCTKQELDFVFGPISQILVEGEESDTLYHYSLDEEEGLNREVVHFGVARPAAEDEAAEQGQAPIEASSSPEVAGVLKDVGKNGGSQDLELVRDALVAHPGDEALLAYLSLLGRRRYQDALEGIDPLRDALEDLQDHSPSALEPVLKTFSDAGSWKAVFVALAPAFQGRMKSTDREQLVGCCQVLLDLAEFAEQTQDMRARLREVKELKDSVEEKRAAKSALAGLKGMAERMSSWEAPEKDKKVASARRGIDRLVTRMAARKEPSARSAISGLTSLLVSLGAHGGGDEQKAAARVAKGLIIALTGTTGEDGVAPATRASAPRGAPSGAGAPFERKRRYTMRRKALPFTREKLVIRDEQMAAMGAVVRQGLEARLMAHVKKAHPKQLEEMGLERAHEIVSLGVTKAHGYGIQKVPAITTLVDLMFTIDPEFTELDEYDWARRLLECDMLDPNTRPDAVRMQLED